MHAIDANLTPKLWSYAAHYAVLIYNNFPHCALDNHKSPNDAYGDSCDFSKLYVYGSICYALQPSKLLHKLEERSAKGLFLLPCISDANFISWTSTLPIYMETERNHIHDPTRGF
jgi:hypothetical protein